MNLQTLDWDPEIPRNLESTASPCCPRSVHQRGIWQEDHGHSQVSPVAGDLGDQQAALFGQTCF